MTESTALTPLMEVKNELAPMKAEFGAVLPSHITADKFAQVCLTALENNPQLLSADRQSFKVACLNAANDGLLPDKREGAFVVFWTEVEIRTPGRAAVEKKKVPLVQWMPMITGILKKAYQTGKVASIAVEMVYKNDVYRRAAGDDAVIVHEPLDFGDRGPVVGGYAIINMRDGGVYREVMSLEQIDKVRNISRSKDKGPWVTFWEEMAKKTILRRALKRVPLSAEVDQVLSRDDVFYNLDAERSPLLDAPVRPSIPRAALFANKAAIRAEAPSLEAPAPPQEAPAEPEVIDAGVEEPEEQSAVVRLVTAIRHCETLSDLLDLQKEGAELETDNGSRQWIEDTVSEARERLMAPVDETPEGGDTEVAGKAEGEASSESSTEDAEPVPFVVGDADETVPSADPAIHAFDAGTETGTPSTGEPISETLNGDDLPEGLKAPVYRALITSGMAVREYDSTKAWAEAVLSKLASIDATKALGFYRANRDYMTAVPKDAEYYRVVKALSAKGISVE